jgi:hypothetical protein
MSEVEMKVYREWSVTSQYESTGESEDDVVFETVGKKPKFKVGDWREVYYGEYEGWNVLIKDVRYYMGESQYRKPGYQYLVKTGFTEQWIDENALW